ncbi:MAG: hypothetical protein JW915_03545 [Chitinispirillaceae bacterium]|nr:hypothetical protein [Chitinispirillaceae bacterium]
MAALHLGPEGYATDGINGKVRIGTATPQAVVDITGSYTAAGDKVYGVKNSLTITAQGGSQQLVASEINPVYVGENNSKTCLEIMPTSPLHGMIGIMVDFSFCTGTGNADSAGIRVRVDEAATGILSGADGSGTAIKGIGYGSGSTGGEFHGQSYALKTGGGRVHFANQVGIGFTEPVEKLDVNGNINSSGNIYALGNVGIGTATPSEKLYISGDNARFIIKGVTNTTFTAAHIQNSNGDGIEMVSYGRSASGSYLGHNRAGAAFYSGSPNTVLGVGTMNAKPLVFGTDNAERMRITFDGNVGIGVEIPTQKLDVNGNIKISGTNKALILTPCSSAPSPLVDGMIAYANGTNWNPGSGKGIYAYYNSTWNKL